MKKFEFAKIRELMHGANAHQVAGLYSGENQISYEIKQGKELTYNNILNATAALELIAEFYDVACVAVIKNTNPTCVSLGSDLINAYNKALDSDPVSQFGSTIALTREVDKEMASKLALINFELIVAPSFCNDALKELEKNQNIKLLQINTALNHIPTYTTEEIITTPFGTVIQEKDRKDFDTNAFKIITKKKPEQTALEDMIFAFKVVKHVKSSAVVIAKDLRTVAISSGEGNGIDSLEIAYSKVCDSAKDTVVAFDCPISTINNIQVVAQNRSVGIIQPAGTIRDNQLADYADKLNISMVSTGISHLKY